MRKKLVIICLSLLVGCLCVSAQETKMSNLEMQADRENGKGNKVNARAFYLRAYEDYVKKGELVKVFVNLDTELAAIKSELQDMPQRKQAILDKYLK